jgi:predicted DNA-binding transcriptional regulator AlpA
VPIPGGFSIVECLQTYHRPITAKELQPILGVTRSHLYAMSKNGDIPAIHLPGSKRIQFEPAVIIAWYRKYSGSRKPVRRVG